MMTHHGSRQMQRRGIPPFAEYLLDEFGERQHDGHGGVLVFFTKAARRRMEREMGREPVRMFSKYFRYYKVDSSHADSVITVAPRHKRIRR